MVGRTVDAALVEVVEERRKLTLSQKVAATFK